MIEVLHCLLTAHAYTMTHAHSELGFVSVFRVYNV
jgi:hypothetical protein